MTMYRFKVRPGYNSPAMLIDFSLDEADDVFFGTLYGALQGINPSKIDLTDLWADEDVTLQCDSDLGEFEIVSDIYDLVYITANDNQKVILEIGELLSNHDAFIKQQYDTSVYS